MKILLSFSKIQDLSVFCKGQIGELNQDVVRVTPPASFKSLVKAQISAIPARMHYNFKVVIEAFPVVSTQSFLPKQPSLLGPGNACGNSPSG